MNQPDQPQDSSPQQHPVQPGYPQQGYAPPGYAPYPQPYPPQRKGMSGLMIGLIIGGILFGVLFIGGLLVGILAVATVPKLTEANEKLDAKQLGDLTEGLRQIQVDDAKKSRLKKSKLRDTRGAEFWGAAIQEGVLDPELGKRLTSLCGRDVVSTSTPPPASAISFTAPQGSQLMKVLGSKGKERCIVMTYNSRNWRNLGGDRVPVMWSDGDRGEIMSFDDAQRDWGITRAEWDDPAGQLFGKKAPFHHTYD